MATAAGIVAEFNPFHNGHAALAAAAGQKAEYVVAVMSGNFVQRGVPAITDKRIRTRAALLGGIDLILELPLPWAAAGAQCFARGAVSLLAATGCVDMLVFGSECGDAAVLRQLADIVEEEALQPLLRERLAEGITWARARSGAVAQLYGSELAEVLEGPNNTLGIEYLRAAAQVGWQPQVETIKRIGAAHDSADSFEEFASGALLRGSPAALARLYRYVPKTAGRVYAKAFVDGLYPADPEALSGAMLAHLRRLSPAELAVLPDLSEGIENRLYAAIRQTGSLQALAEAVKTKRYTMARVRRLILSAFLGIRAEDTAAPPPYLRILGFTPRGRELLTRMKSSATLPLSQSLARLRENGGACERLAALEELATDLYALALQVPPACGYEHTAGAVFLGEGI